MKKSLSTFAAGIMDDETRKELIDGLVEAGRGVMLGLRDRKRAKDHAKSVGGKAHPEYINSRGYWVVWKDGRPLATYPRYSGDLDAELKESKHYGS